MLVSLALAARRLSPAEVLFCISSTRNIVNIGTLGALKFVSN